MTFLVGELNGSVGSVHVLDEPDQFLLRVGPKHEYVIDESPVVYRFQWAAGQDGFLEFAHEGIGICRSKFGAHGGAEFLQVIFVVKLESVEFEYNLQQVSQDIRRWMLWICGLSDSPGLMAGLYAFLVWNVGVQAFHIYGDQPCVLFNWDLGYLVHKLCGVFEVSR